MSAIRSLSVALCAVLGLFASPVVAQSDDPPPLTSEQLEQVVAPIALYPDDLVSQVLMASTYPLEIVEADRWAKANPKVTGDALANALNEQDWDDSVKSLVNFPDVLDMMSKKLDWTTSLGDAFISQQKDVLATIQSMRAKAKAQGNLDSNDQQTVVVDNSGGTEVIVIQPAEPNVVYVPTYNPATVYYSTWPYPAYPPYAYYPPSYVARPGVAFGVGLAVGAAWGHAYGNCNWGRGDIDININKNASLNRNINRNRNSNRNRVSNGTWKHDASHRKGVGYRDHSTAQRFNRGPSRDASRARQNYRGRADAGRRDLNRSGAGSRGNGRSRSGSGLSNQRRTPSRSGNRSSAGRSNNHSAFGGSHHSPSRTRSASSRGSRSRSHAGGHRSGGHRGGGRRR